jgi:hypothetical protein
LLLGAAAVLAATIDVRRIAAVAAVLSGALIGALLVRTSMVAPLVLATALALLGGLIYLATAARAQANTPAGRA